MTPPDPWPDILAAYADGELDPVRRAAVDRWLAAHPDARAELRAQRHLSPQNRRLWAAAEPPEPTIGEWAAVRRAVAAALTPVPSPAPPRPTGWRIGAVAAAAVIAGAATVWFTTRSTDRRAEPEAAGRVEPNPAGNVATGPAGAEGVRSAVASADDPLDGPLVLAAEGDVELAAVEPHPAWPAGEPRMTTAPGDAPMIYAGTDR